MKQATDEANIWAAKSVLQARIKMAIEAGDPAFDKTTWVVAKWKQAMVALGRSEDETGESTVVVVDGTAADGSGVGEGDGGVVAEE